jgi:hypothetical protein
LNLNTIQIHDGDGDSYTTAVVLSVENGTIELGNTVVNERNCQIAMKTRVLLCLVY